MNLDGVFLDLDGVFLDLDAVIMYQKCHFWGVKVPFLGYESATF
jgi:hypothetical protein